MLATHENGAVAACAVDAGRSEREPEVRARLRGGEREAGGTRGQVRDTEVGGRDPGAESGGAGNKTYLL